MRTVLRLICCVIGLHVGFLVLTYILVSYSIEHSFPRQIILDNEPVLGWEKNVSRDVKDYISYDNFHLIPENICDRSSLLLIIICSSIHSINARMAIRQTWGQVKVVLGENVSIYFLVGETTNLIFMKHLKSEIYNFGDLIQGKFLDTYNNLTLKSIYMLDVAIQYCTNTTKFLLKIDDDILFNTEKLIQILKEIEAKNILMGRLEFGANPIKNPIDKWYLPNYLCNDSVLPNYVFGPSYLMSLDVAKKLFKAALSTPIIHLEDVYITGICAKKAGVIHKNNTYFTAHTPQYSYTNCEYVNRITLHGFDPEMLMTSYKQLNDSKIEEECKMYKPKFNAHEWVLENIINKK